MIIVCIICTRRTLQTAQKLKRHVSENNRHEAKIILPGRDGTMDCISDKLFNHRVGPTSTQISLAKFATKDAIEPPFHTRPMRIEYEAKCSRYNDVTKSG